MNSDMPRWVAGEIPSFVFGGEDCSPRIPLVAAFERDRQGHMTFGADGAGDTGLDLSR